MENVVNTNGRRKKVPVELRHFFKDEKEERRKRKKKKLFDINKLIQSDE